MMLDVNNMEEGRSSLGLARWRAHARISFLLLCVARGFMALAMSGWQSSLITYLIKKFNFDPIFAAQIYNLANGCMSFLPLAAAIVADSYFGCFPVASVSCLISFLGIGIISLTATVSSLRPRQCTARSSICERPSMLQSAILYVGIALSVLGVGGSRFTMTTLGANQFDDEKLRGAFFNWSFFALNVGITTGLTLLLYVEDSVSWSLGFWISAGVNLIAFAVFLTGYRCYRHIKPQGSPFTSLARVMVASVKKRKLLIPSDSNAYYSRIQDNSEELALLPREKLRFLNRAAIISEGDVNSEGLIVKRWRLCTVQQVEDLKMLIGVSPLLISGILLSTPIAVQNSMTVLQASKVDRRLGPSFEIPAGSVLVLVMLTTTIWLTFIDCLLFPACQKLAGSLPTFLQRVGVGHVFIMLGMVVSALVESKRLHRSRHSNPDAASLPMSVLWLFPQLILVGIGEAFHYPGQLSFFYREFPESLKSSATAVVGATIGIAYYMSIAAVGMFRRRTTWLPQDLDKGRLDIVYWVLAAVGLTNFGYFIACACLYKPKEKTDDSDAVSGANLN
ncbi:hypothetical protein MLD38_040146 [Melastoma candidum]|uniref:Uncharacterized protein n=1 Tax=Melastoma candidum TaxID=119954 RepID=A0ACB9L5A7_9MYRT|nr:hypothetical protein MLD38_040146 [Melastoma candidum]